jgi:adenosylcobinamide kinase/adenosylcobinamide-phosphate guanylyltransferase
VAQRLRELTCGYDVVVLDCVTLLVSNWLLAGWLASEDDDPSPAAVTRLVDDLCDALSGCAAHAVVVSNEVGGGTVPEHAVARRFRDELGTVNRILAEKAEVVRLLVAGLPLVLKERN